MVNVLFVWSTPVMTSLWGVNENVINGIDTSQFSVHAVVNRQLLADEPHALRERPGVVVRPFDFGYGNVARTRAAKARVLAALPRAAFAMARYARRSRVDVVYTNEDRWSVVVGWCVARAAGARLVLHYHTVPEFLDPPGRRLMRLLGRRADYNIGVSRFVAGRLAALGLPPRGLGFVRNGIDVRRFVPDVDGSAVRRTLGIGDDTVLVVQVARIWRLKRQEDLVRAVAAARRRHPNLHCLIVGWDDPRYDGPYASYREELEALARDEGVADAVTIWKARPYPEEVQAAADVGVLPSIDEPFGLVIPEAMACERPVVATRSGGLPEIVDHGETGFLVEPQSPDELADRLVQLARDPALRARMGRAGRGAVVERFSVERLARDFEAVFRAAAAGAPLPAAIAYSADSAPAASRGPSPAGASAA